MFTHDALEKAREEVENNMGDRGRKRENESTPPVLTGRRYSSMIKSMGSESNCPDWCPGFATYSMSLSKLPKFSVPSFLK